MKIRKPIIKPIKPPVEHERRVPAGLEELLHETKGRPYCGFFRLTKEIAKDWFENHINQDRQRSLREDNVTVLLRLQEEGLWTDYKSEVVFDTRRDVRNGQHVLATLIDTKTHQSLMKSFTIKLLLNLPPSDCDSWDLIRKRSAADELKIAGEEEKRNTLGSAAKVLWQFLHNYYEDMGYLYDRASDKIASPPEAVRTVKQNPDLRLCIFPLGKCFEKRQFSGAAVYAAYCILRRIDQLEADRFFLRGLNEGSLLTRKSEPIGKGDPVWELRNRFLSTMEPKDRLRNGVTMALVFKAWNLHRAGAKVAGSLRMGKNEPFPLLEPMEVPDGPQASSSRH